MMKQCPECGSTEIIPDLAVYTYRAIAQTNQANYVVLQDPAKHGKPVSANFRAAVCGTCGHVEWYTNGYKELLDAHKKGYVTRDMP